MKVPFIREAIQCRRPRKGTALMELIDNPVERTTAATDLLLALLSA